MQVIGNFLAAWIMTVGVAAMPKSNVPALTACAAAPEPEPRATLTSRPWFFQKPLSRAMVAKRFGPSGIQDVVKVTFVGPCDTAGAASDVTPAASVAAPKPFRALRREIGIGCLPLAAILPQHGGA